MSEAALNWFFPLSKIFELVATPSHVLLWLVLGTAVTLVLGKWRAARVLGVAAASLFVLIAVVPLGPWLVRPIEDRFPREPLPAHVDGILTLGGGLRTSVLLHRGAPGSSPSIDRLVSTLQLAREHPEARVVFSGGWGADGDAVAARSDLLRMGLDPRRLSLETRSHNTYENLLFTQALIHPRPSQVWVLATSANQMPRAMQIARRLGWPMIAWPTDYQTEPWPYTLWDRWFEVDGNLLSADYAMHEWIGLATYTTTGLASGKTTHNTER